MSEKIEVVVEKAVREAFKEFDGLYMGWFTPEELDLTIEALEHYGEYLHKQANNPDRAALVFDLLVAMNELKEEGEVEE